LNINCCKSKGKKFIKVELIKIIINCLNLGGVNISVVSICRLIIVNIVVRKFILYCIFIIIGVNINSILLGVILIENKLEISINELLILISNC